MTSLRWSRRNLRAALLVTSVVLLIASSASATYPGKNGRIAFIATFSGTLQLYTINPDGTGLQQITNLPPTEFPFWNPDYSPDGKRLVFSHDMSGAPELYVINVDGTGLAQLTNDGTENIFPRWSPDGTHITFSSLFIDDRFFYHHLVSIKADGSERQTITKDLFDDYQVDYTTDGQHLIFASTRRNLISALWNSNPDGSGKRQFTAPALEAGGPGVSPDGKHLAFYSHQNSEAPSSIWVGNVNGTHVRRLTRPKDLNTFGPVYSPDGSKIVFNGALPGSGTFNMYVMNADGSDRALILSCPDGGCLFPDWGSKP